MTFEAPKKPVSRLCRSESNRVEGRARHNQGGQARGTMTEVGKNDRGEKRFAVGNRGRTCVPVRGNDWGAPVGFP